ncbi:hypothetical protein LSH36_10g03041 [Paralvinella palmiformis]|uniref:ABC transporter domain-containing protein n=1 Tax=Paralvinella palmiformis TaxID=53620 RepID=A0AAD9NIC3_9ANNE|nr:hypothetical protein LSH36_10g03041 [Paralvinella palmiformis]
MVCTYRHEDIHTDKHPGETTPVQASHICVVSFTVGQNWETFVNKLEQLDVGTLQISNVTSLLHIQPHHLGANVYDMSKNHITVLYNDTAVHSLPIGLNLLSNALAAMVGPIAMPLIKTNSNPWPVQDFTGKEYTSFAAAMFIGLAMVYVPASLAMLLVREREKKIFNQLRVSSVSYMVYWISAFSSDIAQLFAIALCAIIIIFAFQVKSLVTGGAMLCLCLMYLLYLPLNLILAYAMTFGFSSFEKAQNVMYNIYTLIVIIPSMAVSFLDVTGHTSIADGLHYLFCVIDPPYVFIQIIYYINKVYLMSVVLQGPNVSIPISAYFTWDSNILIIFLPPFVHIPLLVLLIHYLETRRICCKTNQSELKKERVLINYTQLQENLHGEDTDVQEERDRVKRLVLEQPPSNTSVPAVAVDSISKVYVGSKSISPCSSREPCIKHAVNNLSFSVNKGEVFGLLGPNGAGKSTTINMITAQTASSRGKITVGGVGVTASLSYNQLGYCPQHDALYDDITLREHLDLYIALRGYSKKMRRAIINYYSQLLQLDDHLNKHVSKLSGGTKRKLSYCMAMIGRPSLVLLDEPSTGLDPKSKRRLWDAVNQTFSQREKAAILTTHYMEEADALCTRIAIMINGQMVCLGSAQHLKNKYGSGYMLEVKLSRSNNQRSNALHQYITTLIPGAERAEHFAERATYRISQSAICSIAEIFKSLQQNKETLNIEDYSFSQSTLEQVFLRFARRQSDARDTDRVIDLNVSHHNLIEQRESPV